MKRPQLVLFGLLFCLLAPSSSSESSTSDNSAVEGSLHRVPLSALQTSESVAYHVPANPPSITNGGGGSGGGGGGGGSHHSIYQPQTTVSPNRRFPAIAMLFPTTLTPFSSHNSSPSYVHHHLRGESSSVGASKYHSAEQYEPVPPPRRPQVVTQYGGSELSRPLRREPQHIYGSLSKAQSPYSYAQGSPLDIVEKRPQEVSYEVPPPVVPDTPPRYLYERPLIDHERPTHARPLTSMVDGPQYSDHGRPERPPQMQQQQQQQQSAPQSLPQQQTTLYGSPKFTSSSQLRSGGQYPQLVTEKPAPSAPQPPPSYVRPIKYASSGSPSQSPSSSSGGSSSVNGGNGGSSGVAADEVYGVQPSAYHHRGGGGSRQEMSQHQQPESRVPDQEEPPQPQPSRKLHPQAEASPMYARYPKNSQENTRLEDSPSAEKQTPSYQNYPVGLYGSGGSDGGRNTRRRYNLVYIPVDVLKKLLTEAGYRRKK
ncbi:basic salivary proline-rich protein 1-like [Dermacentor silvarum]|uniref:basic salivary proline-rich protein 1-like n=1 Tax=Dermacentor silvarum TaxID=543639 RepID=UPI0021018F9D|nr:basic salivary proline-rich protein 1-like [Dermacentor silvarum]